jgi:hypothetical protein
MKIYKLDNGAMQLSETVIGHRYLNPNRSTFRDYCAVLTSVWGTGRQVKYYMYQLDSGLLTLELGIYGRRWNVRIVVVGTVAEIENLIVGRINRRPKRKTFRFHNIQQNPAIAELMPRVVAAMLAMELST